MLNFHLIRDGVNVAPFLDEIAGVDNAWEAATGRQEKIQVQREALSIPLRGLRKSALNGRKRRDVLESRWTGGSVAFPHARRFIQEIADSVDGLPGRAKIVNLPPGKRVYPHIDRGLYYRVHARFHLVLRSAGGSMLRTGGETKMLKVGELWWFDNNKVHEAWNDGDENRVHLIFDVLPAAQGQLFAAQS
ncbi:MAG: aspartyl/asparaginyl beta-hydroxylase domain-containing protein [Pseudomonadota bacterium]